MWLETQSDQHSAAATVEALTSGTRERARTDGHGVSVSGSFERLVAARRTGDHGYR